MRIGIISDTHGLVRPEVTKRLAGVHHVIHAGDIGRPEVISELRKIGPITAIRGNIDRDPFMCFTIFKSSASIPRRRESMW
jgi:hypothetical protein